jgi:hypothetical protein
MKNPLSFYSRSVLDFTVVSVFSKDYRTLDSVWMYQTTTGSVQNVARSTAKKKIINTTFLIVINTG